MSIINYNRKISLYEFHSFFTFVQINVLTCNVYKTANKGASTNTNQILLSNNWLELSPRSFPRVLKRLKQICGEIAFQKRFVFYS